ncbi:MAG TPA: carbohydrate binding family 9 domain-containing protein, partial [Vicinamibacteria bacterium]
MIALLTTAVLQAGTPPVPEAPAVQAARVDERIEVDGLLDDAAWTSAPPASGFRQREPVEGAGATEDTVIRVLLDHDTLYVGVLALDREPARILARLLQRDVLMRKGGDNAYQFAGDDAVALVLDPFQDHRNAFLFATNPNGAEFDALVTDESPVLNVDWRGVWRVAARRVPTGWSAEFAIPLRTLRYPRTEGAQAWGFNVERMIRRKNEDTLWTGWSRATGGL